MAQLADKVPELYQIRYNEYLNELEQQRADVDMVLGIDNTYYDRYRDTVADSQWQQSFDYNAAVDQRDFDYNAALTDREWQYMLEQDALAQQMKGGGGGGGSGKSADYSTVSKKAAKFETSAEALNYLNNMVAIGAISEDEKNRIYQVELGGTFDGGAGMDLAKFRAAEKVMEMQLKAENAENAQSHLNAIWGELNNEQKAALGSLFAMYGYTTEEE
jgi:hypothetical protein